MSEGNCGGEPAMLSPMAGAALALIDSAAACCIAGVFRQRCRPRHLVRVDVENSGRGIDGRPAPLGAAVEAGKYDRVLADAERNELACAAELSELLDRPAVSFRSAIGQQIFSQPLARIGRRLRGQRLLRGGDFAGTLLAGYFWYSMGNSGLPLLRSNR